MPRLPPLWTTELGPARGAVSGLSPDLDPLGIAELALVDSSAARVLLPEGQPMPTDAYWRVLVHEQFDGRRWQHRDPPAPPRRLAHREVQDAQRPPRPPQRPAPTTSRACAVWRSSSSKVTLCAVCAVETDGPLEEWR